ncbi:hypothetical protein [Gluconobacter oxydans]|uniref:hypothetical protein n=1 Tax=Gluconobacter oxydans TaxID=442 RepID=UPI0012DAACB8|nr:hypothetical protein [Gluconobacter oxydans]
MRKGVALSLAALSVFLIACQDARADQNCRAVLTRDIGSNTDHFDGIEDTKKGSVVEYIHLQSINDDGSPQTFAVHGGGIYPADAVKLLNCHIERHKTSDGLGFKYDTYLDDTPDNAKEILRASVEDQLLDLGVDEADASNASESYISHDGTACAQAVKSILAGNREIASLITGSQVCQPKPNVGK